VGCGSVGKRHQGNLAARGCEVWGVDPRADRLAEAAAVPGWQGGFEALQAALGSGGRWDGAVVGSPPSLHVDHCLALAAAGLPILLEKPVCPTLAEGERLAERLGDHPLLLGYTYRWWPPLVELREWLAEGRIGRPLRATFTMSAHLADWHPWERYQDFFMASRALGGGALLDESHFLDLLLWLFGAPSRLFARVERLSDLEIDTDDNVDVLAAWDDGLRVSVHLDLYGRPHEKLLTVTGEEGTIRWSFEPNELALGTGPAQQWETRRWELERNDMFVGVARELLELLDGRTDLTCTLDEGLDVLRLVEACRESSASGRDVRP